MTTLQENLLILGCSATKRADAGMLPAIDRYDGPMYRVLRKALRERDGLTERLKICVISANYGLVAADTPIPAYDWRMSWSQALVIRPKVKAQAMAMLNGQRMPGLVMCGDRYHAALPTEIWHAGLNRTFGAIGCQLAQLKAWLWGLTLEETRGE